MAPAYLENLMPSLQNIVSQNMEMLKLLAPIQFTGIINKRTEKKSFRTKQYDPIIFYNVVLSPPNCKDMYHIIVYI